MPSIRKQVLQELRKGTLQKPAISTHLNTSQVIPTSSHVPKEAHNQPMSTYHHIANSKQVTNESSTSQESDSNKSWYEASETVSVKEQPFNQSGNSPSHSGRDVIPPSTSILVPNVKSWESLNPDLQAVFPPDEKFSYIVEKYESKPCETFPGAPPFAFECQVRINVGNEEEATEWLAQMEQHSSVTYRVTRTTKLQYQRVAYKTERHCQHFRKQLTTKQVMTASQARSKKASKPLVGKQRDKKTHCSSHLVLTVQIPTKKQQRQAESKPFVLTHTGVLRLTYTHNHPITSAHALSFRDIGVETKEAFYNLFEMGHSASSARHAHQQALYIQADSEAEAQRKLADRAQNPLIQDICRLFTKWREANYGTDDGKDLFEKLQEKVDHFNATENVAGGKAILQWYEAPEKEDMDDLETQPPPTKKQKKREKGGKPLILAICTPLMARAHSQVRQAGEILFCDSTSSMDRFNTSLFMLSTTHACSGIPLAVVMVSDESEPTIIQAIEMVKKVLPSDAFYGNGASTGPQVIMIDDSTVEQAALSKCWPCAKILLCTFHFLQRRWTWLLEGRNKIHKEDRISLMQSLRSLVYSNTEEELNERYTSLLSSDTAKKYPHFTKHVSVLWEKKRLWAHCFRKLLLIRGNHTNNYAEAGIKILKELIFGRVKAYNLVQMFYFVVETLELYYKRKLVNIANNRLESYIAARFQGLNAKKISKDNIIKVDQPGWYKVKSLTEEGQYHDVNTHIGVCTCPKGQQGSPCSHQAAIVINYGEESCNYIATISASARMNIARLAIGDGAIHDVPFYSSLHQKELDEQYGSHPKSELTKEESQQLPYHEPSFSTTGWDALQSGTMESDSDHSEHRTEEAEHIELHNKINSMAEVLKDMLKSHNPQLISGVSTFLTKFNKLSAARSQSKLVSALHQFGWEMAATTVLKAGQLRHGKRIAVQATAAGRRRKGRSKGKGKEIAGRPPKSSALILGSSISTTSRYCMPVRNEPKGRRLHSLLQNINSGQQNAGKW